MQTVSLDKWVSRLHAVETKMTSEGWSFELCGLRDTALREISRISLAMANGHSNDNEVPEDE